MVERDLAKVDVAGSTPVSRSRYLTSPALAGLFILQVNSAGGLFLPVQLIYCSGRGTQVVRERSAKPLCVGSIPTRASKLFSPAKNPTAIPF